MTARVSHGLNDCQHLKVVSVISSFDCYGHIMPLYVRIDGESLKVYNAHLCPESTFRLLHYRCEVMDHDRVKPIKLIYHINDLRWTIPVN